MSRPTPAQRQLLERLLMSGHTVSFSPVTGSAWTADDQGYTVKVNKAVFNALTLSGRIGKIGSSNGTDLFGITIAGRESLRGQP